MKSILDPSFRYTASFDTDIRRTFANVRRARRKDAEQASTASAEARIKVSSIAGKIAAR